MGELGAGSNSGFPGALDTKQTFANVASPDADGNTRMDAEVLNDVLDALIKIETELGVDPAGSDTDVVTRLVAIEAASVLITGARALTGNWDAGSFEVRAQTFQSDVATGTAPFIVASTTVVANLNAATLAGELPAAFQDVDAVLTDLSALSVVALNEFIVGTGAGTYDHKTLAETGAILEGDLDHGNIQGLGDDDHTIYLLADATRALTANWDVGAFVVTVLRLVSDQATGTAPFTVASTTVVANLNADLLDGEQATAFQDQDAVLDDLAALSAVADNQVIVGTGAGTYAHEAATTLPATIGGNIQDLDTLGAIAAKGQLISASGAGVLAYLSVGTNDQVLTAASGETTGLKWGAAGGGGSDAAPMTPQGRLTLVTAVPVMVTEQADKTTIFYTPYLGDLVPIFGGSSWTNTLFTELSIAMAADADWALDKIYDLYVADDGGTLRLVTGAAWTNDTTRSEALSRQNGILSNDASMTGRWGPVAGNVITVEANRGTYVGTFRTTGTAGTTTWELGGSATNGDPGKLYLWNMYNRKPVSILVADSTDSWTYTTKTWRSRNASTTNRVTFVRGLDEDGFQAICNTYATQSGSAISMYGSIGLDSTSAFTGFTGRKELIAGDVFETTGWYLGYPGLGLHFLQHLEASGASGTTTWRGDFALGTFHASGLSFMGLF